MENAIIAASDSKGLGSSGINEARNGADVEHQESRRIILNEPQITEDTTVVIDLDYVAFSAASAAERSYVEVIHKPSGKVKEFKNKTEFRGRGKAVGGWLKETNDQRIEKGQEPFEEKDFDIESCWEPEPIENCLHTAKMIVEGIKKHLGVTKMIGVMGEGENYRHKLPLPVKYKGNRDDTHRPAHLKKTREYLKKKYATVDSTGTDEADALITQYQFQGYRDYKRTGVLTYVSACIDKDNAQSYGMWFDCYRIPGKGEWRNEKPIWVDGLGTLYRNEKGDVKGTGFKFLMFQTLHGDWDTDYFSPTQPFKIRMGQVKCFNLLDGLDTHKELVEAVVKQYKEWFPETEDCRGIKYKSHCGKDMNVSAMEMADMIFACAYMRRWETDTTTFTDLCKKFEVEY